VLYQSVHNVKAPELRRTTAGQKRLASKTVAEAEQLQGVNARCECKCKCKAKAKATDVTLLD
jgi:hypothetical protein